MTKDEVITRLNAHFKDAKVVCANMGNKFEVKIVSSDFEGLRTVKRQQMVYAVLNDAIASGAIHALTIHAHTPSEV